MKPTLVVLAAGMGSRYGGLKQVDPVGPSGEAILDYSVFDALRGGFGKVVFVIRHDFEAEFKEKIGRKFESMISVDYCYQDITDLPAPYTVPAGRTKPWGTAHATRAARSVVDGPFAVINADDFYGRQAFEVMADFLSHSAPTVPPTYAMVGYRLNRTLSRNGTVSRGVCQTNAEGYLTDIVENHKIGYTDKGIENIEEGLYNLFTGEEPVSMNFWGFTPDFFQALEEQFVDFMRENHDNIKAEYPIPNVIAHLMSRGEARVKVLHSDAEWFGVTYKEDRPYVVERLAQLPD